MKSLVGCLPCVTILLFSPSLAAHAADEIGLSSDAVTWSSSLAEPLFDPALRWVPGNSQTASFFVRNQGPSKALLTIEARSADTDELLSNEDIVLRARADGRGWVGLKNGAPSASMTEQGIGMGHVVRVDVNATFDPAAVNQSQRKDLALSFSVTLVDATAGDRAGEGDNGGFGGLLPDTGAPISVWLIVITSVMLLVGVRLVRVARHG